jgi:hypothetical protein
MLKLVCGGIASCMIESLWCTTAQKEKMEFELSMVNKIGKWHLRDTPQSKNLTYKIPE